MSFYYLNLTFYLWLWKEKWLRQRNLWHNWWPENPQIRYSLEAWEVILRITAASGRGHYRLQAVDECKGTPGNAREVRKWGWSCALWTQENEKLLDKFLHGGVTIGSECVSAQSCPTLQPQTVAHQAPISMEFSRQEYWSGLPFPSPGDLPNPGIESASLALAGEFFATRPPGKPSPKEL